MRNGECSLPAWEIRGVSRGWMPTIVNWQRYAPAGATANPTIVVTTTADVLEDFSHLTDEVFGPTSTIVR